MLSDSIVANTISIKTINVGIATTQKKAKGCFKPDPLAKFMPKYPLKVIWISIGVSNVVTEAMSVLSASGVASWLLYLALLTK